jgi:hypothetical protein
MMKQEFNFTRFSWFVLIFAGAFLCATIARAVVPPPSAEATADAHYQDITAGPDSDSQVGASGGPAILAEARSLTSGTIGGSALPPYAWDDSDGRARASVPGTFGAYARAGGYSPSTGPGDETFATATARTVTNWEVIGETGGTTPIDLSVTLDGFLYVDEYASNPEPVIASMSLLINLITNEGTVNVLDASGSVNVANPGFDGNFVPINDGGSSTFFGSFTPGLFGNSYLIDYFEAFADMFPVNNNEVFAIETILTTTADNQWGPFEVFATSDFYDTGQVILSVNDRGSRLVSHNPIPEPNSYPLLIVATLFAAAYRARFR